MEHTFLKNGKLKAAKIYRSNGDYDNPIRISTPSWIDLSDVTSFEVNVYDNELISRETRLFFYNSGSCAIAIPLQEFEKIYFMWEDEKLREEQVKIQILN